MIFYDYQHQTEEFYLKYGAIVYAQLVCYCYETVFRPYNDIINARFTLLISGWHGAEFVVLYTVHNDHVTGG